MVTAIELLDGLKELIETLPAYTHSRDWERAKSYYLHNLFDVNEELDDIEEEIERTERRVSLLKADIVKLENA